MNPYDASDKPAPGSDESIAQAPLLACDPKRILVIDDEMRIREVFKLILTDGLPDCTIDTAANGQEAIYLFEQGHHSVCVMDLHMSVMDGQAAFFNIERICREREWDMPGVIFCTGFAHPQMVRSVVVRNAEHCLLSKPVRAETLLNIVNTRLAAKRRPS